jgi:acetoin utilization deacetylase AcuC-like enzyme
MFVYISHPICKEHNNGKDHPETCSRLSQIEDQLIFQRLFDFMVLEEAQKASDEDILRVHTPELLQTLKTLTPEEGFHTLDDDTTLSKDSLNAARYAAGSVIMGIDELMNQRASGVFCNIRPPGHHAEINQSMGFCLINNAAIGAAYAFEKYGLERIAILDFDVHHGNGTETYAEQEPRLCFISSYQQDIYPFPSDSTSHKNILKLPLKRGTRGEEFVKIWESQAWPVLKKHRPELIIISAGFDAHRHDLMAGLDLVESDFALWAKSLQALSHELEHPKILSVLEGGYELQALAKSVSAYLKVMADF